MGPLAYLITFRCHGTWLPGDSRGYVDRSGNMFGHPTHEPNPRLETAVKRTLTQPVQLLDAPARAAVDTAIREGCAREAWVLRALHVRTNHVHAVVSAAATPARIMSTFKAWATRRLRQQRLCGAQARPWARHGSTRWLWTDHDVEGACSYVLEGQGAPLAGM
jgi:REP element-mobilizing transposase RayT